MKPIPFTPGHPRALTLARDWRLDPPHSWRVRHEQVTRAAAAARQRDQHHRAHAAALDGDVAGMFSVFVESVVDVTRGIRELMGASLLLHWMIAPDDVRAAHLVPEDIQ